MFYIWIQRVFREFLGCGLFWSIWLPTARCDTYNKDLRSAAQLHYTFCFRAKYINHVWLELSLCSTGQRGISTVECHNNMAERYPERHQDTDATYGTGSSLFCFASVPRHYWITAADWRHNGESIAGQQGRALTAQLLGFHDLPNPHIISEFGQIQPRRCTHSQLSSACRGSPTSVLWSLTIPAKNPNWA